MAQLVELINEALPKADDLATVQWALDVAEEIEGVDVTAIEAATALLPQLVAKVL
jgi:hypothetical protein